MDCDCYEVYLKRYRFLVGWLIKLEEELAKHDPELAAWEVIGVEQNAYEKEKEYDTATSGG